MRPDEIMTSELVTVNLPSKGIPYGNRLPGGLIQVRPLTTREEKMLLSSRVQNRNTLMYDIVWNCISDEDKKKMPLGEYLIGDIIYIFLVIRSATYGPEYTFVPTCKFCGKPMTVDVMIPVDLGIYVLPQGFKEPFEITLPKSGAKIGARLFRVADEQEVQRYALSHPDDENAEYAYRIARHIVSVNGDKADDMARTNALVECMHAVDAEKIREAVINNDCGIDLQLDRPCGDCGRKNEVFFEFTIDFFRSQSAKVRRRRGTIG